MKMRWKEMISREKEREKEFKAPTGKTKRDEGSTMKKGKGGGVFRARRGDVRGEGVREQENM